jgi:electron transfer flavoprotein alpha subunit
MKVLVLIEVRSGAATDDSLGVLTHVVGLGCEVVALVCGEGVSGVAVEVAQYGSSLVLLADDPQLGEPRTEVYAQLIAGICRDRGCSLLLFATSVLTTDLAACLAAQLEAGVNWSLITIARRDEAIIGVRSTHEDTMHAEVAWTTPVRIGLMRPRAFTPGAKLDRDSPIERLATSQLAAASHYSLVRRKSSDQNARASLAAAQTIVAGGRGIGRPENINLLRELAAVLGGTVGVSLPLVDMGWAPRAMQVGQTGTVVKPRLYIACGISGQIQHKIGIEQSGVIIAINTDRNAPIVGFCDLAVVAPLESVLPHLIALLSGAAQA